MVTTSENLPKTGYTKDTPKSFLLNAGAWVKNLQWIKGVGEAAGKWSYDLIGATSDGSKINLAYTYRQVQVDGVFTTPVGADMIDEATATAEINLIEFTLSNLKMMLLATNETSTGEDYPEGYEIVTPGSQVKLEHYVENMAYVGTISGSDKPVIIIFDHAICTSGLEVEPKDKSEAVYPVTFEARTGADNIEQMGLPVKILYPTSTDPSGFAAEGASTKIDGAPETEEAVDLDKEEKAGKK